MPTLSVSAILHTKETFFESGSVQKFPNFARMYAREGKVLVFLFIP